MIMASDPADHHSLAPTRPTLRFRLRNWEDETSWNEFYRMYHNFIYGLTRRSGLSHADAEEVTQDVFKRVAETIHDFESNPERGTFRGWLATLTRWRITDKFRARRPDAGAYAIGGDATDDRTRTIDRIPDPSKTANPWGGQQTEEDEWQRHVMELALNRLARRTPAKHFQVFDLYSRQGWTVLRIAREFSLNPATVYVINHRLTRQLKREAEQLQAQLR